MIAVLVVLVILVGVVSQVGPPLFLQCWQNFVGLIFLGTCSLEPPVGEHFLGLPLALTKPAVAFLTLFLRSSWCLLFTMHLIASRSS
jgi:hypothetical protein